MDKHVGTSYLDSYEMWLEYERLVATIGNNNRFGTFIEAPQQIKSGKWYFFAYTFDNTTGVQKLYIDGVLAKQNNANTTIFCDDEPLLLGASHDNTSPSYYFHGTMDDVRIYNDILTDKEIKSLFETKKDTIVIPPKKDTIVIPPKKDTIVVVVPKKDTISVTPLIVGIYPNPTEADLTIKSNIIINKINIYNCLGQLLISRKINQKLHTLDVSDFPPAGYFIEITTINEERKSYKFIKI